MAFNISHENKNFELGDQIFMRDDLTPISEIISEIDTPILFFNIGCDYVLGDSYGPLLGYMLIESDIDNRFSNVFVMGTIYDSIGATNVSQRVEQARTVFSDCTIIATDTVVGKSDKVGVTTIGKGMFTPGAGVDNKLTPVGDYYITGCTCPDMGSKRLNLDKLPYISMSIVYPLVRRAVDAIIIGLEMRELYLSKAKNIEENPWVVSYTFPSFDK